MLSLSARQKEWKQVETFLLSKNLVLVYYADEILFYFILLGGCLSYIRRKTKVFGNKQSIRLRRKEKIKFIARSLCSKVIEVKLKRFIGVAAVNQFLSIFIKHMQKNLKENISSNINKSLALIQLCLATQDTPTTNSTKLIKGFVWWNFLQTSDQGGRSSNKSTDSVKQY